MDKINKKMFWFCLLGGSIGAHKFLNGEILMGLVYFATGGLWGFGVIYDLIRIVTNTYGKKISEIDFTKNKDSNVVNTLQEDIVMDIDENLLYQGKGYMVEEGSESSGPITYSTPLKKFKKKLKGKFYYTNKRIIFLVDGKKIIEEKLENVNEIKNMGAYINIFVSKIEYQIYLNNTYDFFKIYRGNI